MATTTTRRKWLILAGSTALALIAIELGIRALMPVDDPYWRERRVEIESYIPRRHEPDFQMRVEPELGLPGVTGVRVFATNHLGFVGRPLAPKGAEQHRVFLLGGSTMECFVLGEEHNPATLLQSELSTRSATTTWVVENTAHSGDATFDHLAMLAHRVVHFDPDVVIVLVGVNDVIASLRGDDYRHAHGKTLELDLPTTLRMTLTQLHVARLILGVFSSTPIRFGSATSVRTTAYRSAADRCRSVSTVELDRSKLQLEAYERNLRSIVATATANGARVILATQPHSWDVEELEPWHWLGCFGQGRYSRESMKEALAAFDEVTRRVSAETSAELVDLSRAAMDGRHFYDDVHFSDEGAAFIARRFADAILDP